MRTIPRSHSGYFYFNPGALFDDENTFGLSSPALLEAYIEGKEYIRTSDKDDEDRYFPLWNELLEKTNRNDIKHVMVGVTQLQGNRGAFSSGDIRLFANVDIEGIRNVVPPDFTQTLEYGTEFIVIEKSGKELFHCMVAPYYYGISTVRGNIKVDHHDDISIAASNFGRIIAQDPVFTMVLAGEGFEDQSTPVSELYDIDIDYLSLSIMKESSGPQIYLIAGFSDLSSKTRGYRNLNLMWKGLGNKLIADIRAIESRPNFRNTNDVYKWGIAKKVREMYLRGDLMEKDNTVILKVPYDKTILEVIDFENQFIQSIPKKTEDGLNFNWSTLSQFAPPDSTE